MYTFDTPTTVTAVIDVPAGRVQVIAADRADTTVDVRAANAAKGRDVKAEERTTVELSDGVLRIATPTKNELFGPSGAVEVTVQVPAGSRVEAKGPAELRGVGRLGDVTIESSYGTVKLDEAANLRVTAIAGDVTVGRLTGPAEISTTKGDIRIDEATRGSVELRTQAGDVTVGAASGVSATLDAGTSYGRIENALQNTGSVELEIRATTSYGNISARSN
ncbi:conserved hypothetical protein [Beutenbergia cavernae DSM 12333]|uniref:DUF4097 domain-containing protein n=1 Tax=Beutenbergia cavernae (strain ATCC BAA-8 / DSM 12333 / CCUG 43141 / JCM 11478 / NBRC 16432 / NCIMB 13614 / HKI 0122) TaxID=471853 RepID=C5BX88_BEUC1|nr:DUF4097 family beta strand repeat-containing protein [Beutenbergia cavernae]ACQ78763.1 conserved hypothetical protein [Beutenbergia cavernae DSM 12333]